MNISNIRNSQIHIFVEVSLVPQKKSLTLVTRIHAQANVKPMSVFFQISCLHFNIYIFLFCIEYLRWCLTGYFRTFSNFVCIFFRETLWISKPVPKQKVIIFLLKQSAIEKTFDFGSLFFFRGRSQLRHWFQSWKCPQKTATEKVRRYPVRHRPQISY